MARTAFLSATIITILIIFSNYIYAEENLFEVERLVMAQTIVDREPVEVALSFDAGIERVYCFLEARNIQRDTEVTFVWYHEDEQSASVTVDLKQGLRWRTNSYITVMERTGSWHVDLMDENENVIQTVNFTIE